MENQNDHEIRFVILTQEILQDERLNEREKIVLARITGFDEFFESVSETANFLHMSELVVQRAKRKLEKLGYIEVLADTGRGKRYRASLWKTQQRCDKKVIADMTEKSYQILPKSQTYNKDINKDKVFIGDESQKNVEKSKTEYGRADINELVDLWEKETGIDIKGQQHQRRQLYNLLKKYGCDATKTLVRRVGAASRSHDRFAPQIALPSDLVGKYGKLAKLQMWENRNKMARPFGSPALLPVTKGIPDYNGAWDEQPDDEHDKVSEMMEQARKKLNI